VSIQPASQILATLGLLGIIFGVSGHVTRPGQNSSEPENANPIVARISTRLITLQEVERTAALRLYQIEQQRSHVLREAAQQFIDQELLKAEASRKGLTVEELLSMAPQSESVARLANLPAPVKHHTLNRGQIDAHPGPAHDRQEEARIRQALLVSLRRQADIRLNLPVAEPPVLTVGADDDPSIGPADAPITIVEFSDFQCPYCQKSVATLKELRRLYGDKIRVVYRDYPGPNHAQAVPAAEAAQCAGDQGKFWEFHDLLFARQTRETGWDYEAIARELGLQASEFSACLRTGRYREEVKKDLEDGLALGIASTPTFFINGRPLVGAQPIAEFSRLIDPLLGKQPEERH
jgi:protein-disulfide isomerase